MIGSDVQKKILGPYIHELRDQAGKPVASLKKFQKLMFEQWKKEHGEVPAGQLLVCGFVAGRMVCGVIPKEKYEQPRNLLGSSISGKGKTWP
jgi:hypothetical protein